MADALASARYLMRGVMVVRDSTTVAHRPCSWKVLIDSTLGSEVQVVGSCGF